ncbi:MAG: ArgE/DapE family deacylase [Firmicutes bacterium]|nr:ArgE/DapE family deacylase [Bacillota bacterium]
MRDKLRAVLESRKDEYIKHLFELLSRDTRVIGHGIEGGLEKNGQDYLEQLMEGMGANVTREQLTEEVVQKGIELYSEGNPGHNYDDRYNLVAEFKGGNGPTLMFNGHVDVMPPGDLSLWASDPFKPEIRNGRVYARGVADMKAGLMASVLGVKLLLDAGVELPGDVTLLSVVDEEGGGNGTLVSLLNGRKADATVVCEPTDQEVIVAHMGFLFFEVNVTGISLHSATKWDGVNAIEKAIFLIDALHQLENRWMMIYRHKMLPPPTLNIGVIEGGTAGNDVPNHCTFKFCLHYVPGLMEHEEVIKQVEDALLLRSRGDAWLRENPPTISIYQQGLGFQQDVEHDLVKIAKTSAEQAFGSEFEIAGSQAANDARLMKNIGNMPTIVCGPGRMEDCHTVNESVAVQEYLDFILTYALLIWNWGQRS